MEIVKKTEEYQIVKKRNGRFGVRTAGRKWVTGEEKVKILIAEGLIKAPEPKAEPAEEPAEEAAEEAEASAEGAGEEAPAEDESTD